MLGPTAVKALARELQELQSTELLDLGIRVTINEADVTDISAEIDGPPGTPLKVECFFTTKIWHPNVSKSGEICVNVLKRDWKPELGIRHVLQVIRCLLIEPYPESALNEEAGKALLEDYADYEKHARLMTSLHAQQHAAAKRHMPLTTSTGANASSSGAGPAADAGPGGSGSPALKKARPEHKAAASKVKKSLKRL
ncbi:ubiquitin-conjugating enzyme/RWD-like protein [Scenedesmus sp. NREL 46B-D3]|nr:ubiquitin-conjugating enzyme/RWD-like protein [Scenedesmus sp. NREL 46B-D3]